MHLTEDTQRIRLAIDILSGTAFAFLLFWGLLGLFGFVRSAQFLYQYDMLPAGIFGILGAGFLYFLQLVVLFLGWRVSHMLVDVYSWFASIESKSFSSGTVDSNETVLNAAQGRIEPRFD